MVKRSCCLILTIAIGHALTQGIKSVYAERPFYRGKTVRFVVGYGAGGGFDTYTRAVAGHIGRHIPGNPTIVVENMIGAGGMVAANYLYNKAQPDGLTVGNWTGGLVLQQIFGKKGIQFDARRFEWVGVPATDHPVCALTKASGVTSLADWVASKMPVKIGIGPSGTASGVPRILRTALGLPIKIIDGYRGTAKVRLAAESGEIDGGCWTWQSLKATWKEMVESEGVTVVLQAMPKKHPDLPKVPNAIDVAKTDEARQLLKNGIHDPATITHFYSLPPRTPKERVKILQKAFSATMKDPKFLAAANKSNLEIDPIGGEEVEKIVTGLFKLDPELTVKLRKILVPDR